MIHTQAIFQQEDLEIQISNEFEGVHVIKSCQDQNLSPSNQVSQSSYIWRDLAWHYSSLYVKSLPCANSMSTLIISSIGPMATMPIIINKSISKSRLSCRQKDTWHQHIFKARKHTIKQKTTNNAIRAFWSCTKAYSFSVTTKSQCSSIFLGS